jgi:hypothetical protein
VTISTEAPGGASNAMVQKWFCLFPPRCVSNVYETVKDVGFSGGNLSSSLIF